MTILKCKMCGGSLNTVAGSSVVVCEYCGTKQTIPLLDDDKKIQLFDRANSYRTNCEFDKASLLYEEILSEHPDNAEAHWGVCLCKYGIEYVEDRQRGKRIPTCHRTQFRSILEDPDYIAAINNSEISAKEIYRQEAEYIDAVQRKILSISAKEEPFDIFICYKETDANGDRTKDSVIAQEIYDDLTSIGYKVFFSRITLEDKLGIAYEPYIFAALNSAPLMLIVGTKPEYFNAVWVKNEWSRYLHMIEQGQKKTVVPCYRDMTAADMPIEFSVLQAQDVSKVGWKQDLLRGIGKILPLEKKVEERPVAEPPKQEYTPPPPVSAPPQQVNNPVNQNTYVPQNNVYTPVMPKKKVGVYALLAFLLGYFGAHSFYAGKKTKGIIQIIVFVFAGAALSDPDLGNVMSAVAVFWPWIDAIIAIVKRKVPLPSKYKK